MLSALSKRLVFLPVRSVATFRGEKFRIVEVGARDGLQNEKNLVPTDVKVELINRLAAAGLKTIEATSFVSPKWVPQMADHNEVMSRIDKLPGVAYPVLVPNLAGLKNATKNPAVEEIAVFIASSEGFSRKNINCSVAESLQRVTEVAREAIGQGLKVRGYLSTVIGCPYDGPTKPAVVADLTAKLLEAGCYEVSLGDTIGTGTAGSVSALLDAVLKVVPAEKLAVHFHDTFGQALANVLVSVERGIRVADSSVAGLGGCPYAKGASGNLATEDLVYLLHGLGFDTGIDLNKLVDTSEWLCQLMGRSNASRATLALQAKRARAA